MTSEEIAELDEQIKALEPELYKAHEKYETLVEKMSELIKRRYPERQEDAVKNRLYEAYRKSGKTLDFIIDFIENAPNEDDFWN